MRTGMRSLSGFTRSFTSFQNSSCSHHGYKYLSMIGWCFIFDNWYCLIIHTWIAFSTFSSTSALILFSGRDFLHMRYWHTCNTKRGQARPPHPPAAHLLLHGPHPRGPHLPEVGGLHGEGPEVEQRLLRVPLDDGGVGVEVGEGAQHDATVVHVAQRPLASELGREFDEPVLDFITFTTVSSLCSDKELTCAKFSITRQSLRASIWAKNSLGTGGSTQALV